MYLYCLLFDVWISFHRIDFGVIVESPAVNASASVPESLLDVDAPPRRQRGTTAAADTRPSGNCVSYSSLTNNDLCHRYPEKTFSWSWAQGHCQRTCAWRWQFGDKRAPQYYCAHYFHSGWCVCWVWMGASTHQFRFIWCQVYEIKYVCCISYALIS